VRYRESDSHPSNGCGEISAGHLHIDLLGTFRLHLGNQLEAGFEYARLQHLLAYFALHRTAPISRQQLAFLFWPDSTDQQALKNLRTLLTRLRRAFPEVDQFISVTAQTIQWRLDAPFTLDVAELETAVAQVATAQEANDYTGAAKALATVVAVYTGDLLPGCYDDWILPLRERLQQAYGDALERLVLLLEEHREYSSALPYARRLLSHDPLREAAYHHLIRLHLALGDRTEVLRVCRACETMLEREFGTAMTRATRDLYERLLKAEDQPTLAAMEQPVGIFSSSLPLVGRDAEWSRLMAAWHAAAAGHPQMVLISGEAGIGKTRLAEELCAWVARQGMDVAVAHCYPVGGTAVAYAPVVEWLRDRGLQARLAVIDDIWLVEAARIRPTLLVDHPHLKSPGPLTEAWQRTRLFEALAHAVLGSDDHAPLLLFLDDLQWCDQETLDWLGYLLRFAVNAPLLIVASVRKYEIDRVHPLMSFWFSLTRSGLLSELHLSPLNASETELLAGNVAGRAVDAVEAAQIYHDTEGRTRKRIETGTR
jgi:DNA-binding SARP family transcriptional activator